MKSILSTSLLLFCGLSLAAQTPASAPAAKASAPAVQTPAAPPVAQMHASELGFAYGIPTDWEVVDAAPMLPVVRQQVAKDATSQAEKQGAACVDLALTARHGNPPSVIVIVTLPFDCFGQVLADKDLPAFAVGVAEGLKKTFTMVDPAYGAYTLGAHSVWIERAAGISIANPGVKRTVETVCALLKKGAVCWMSMAADEDGVRAFEHGAVVLDGEPAVTLVPADAIQKKP